MKRVQRASQQNFAPAAPDVHTHTAHTTYRERVKKMKIIAIIAAVFVAGSAIISGGTVAYAKADAVYDRAATQSRVATIMGH